MPGETAPFIYVVVMLLFFTGKRRATPKVVFGR